MERLQKIIANSGVSSRRKAEELILKGRVKVNGQVVTTLGYKANDKDKIEVNNTLITKDDKVYYLLNKPRGVITSTSDELGRKTVIDLIKEDKRIYPVGRLDYDTTGALILTNDGDFANMMMHPANKIDKVYVAKVTPIPTPKDLMMLKNGIIIDGKRTAKARVKLKKADKTTNTAIVEVTIHEGRNHQVKRMFEAINLEVEKLKRERVSFLDLTNIKSGEYRVINPKEVRRLYVEANFDKK